MIWKSGMFSICLGHTFTINDSRFFNAAFVQTWRETWKSSSNGEDMFLVGCYAAQMRWKREDMSIFSNFGRSNISFWEVHWCKRILKLTSTKTSILKSNSKNQPHPTTVKLRAHSTWRFSYWKLPFLLLIALLPGSSTPPPSAMRRVAVFIGVAVIAAQCTCWVTPTTVTVLES